MIDSSTIIAQCTPLGAGAIAMLRLSGTDAWSIIAHMSTLPRNKVVLEQQTHTVHYAHIRDGAGALIDQVMIILMRGPHTFTGEDVVEITCHNNQFIIESIIGRALELGARLAGNGEFSQRAFAHGKIDLLQAEAIHELITANTALALKKSLAQLEGTFSHWVTLLESELIRALAWCEASFEFLDEEEEFGSEILKHLEQQIILINKLKSSFDQQHHIKNGIRIALIGSVNAGKSSLFNALIGHNRAIVSSLAGTTRDSIEAQLNRNGSFWTLIDTAGLRQTHDAIEAEGIIRSQEEAHKADIIVLVIDGSRTMTTEEQQIYCELYKNYDKKIIFVINKSDTLTVLSSDIFEQSHKLYISAITGDGVQDLEQHIQQKIDKLLSLHESPYLLNKRQFHLIAQLQVDLNHVMTMLRAPLIQYELVSHHLRQCLESLTELTGKSVSEAGMDRVFKEFCVGK